MSDQKVQQLVQFIALIEKWNRTFNLVSRQDVRRLVDRHVLDSLSGVGLLRGEQMLDLGSGAGFPGVVLAIAAPESQFTLCDRSARRTRFLQQVKRSLGLANIEVWQGDFGQDHPPQPETFDTVVARGVTTAEGVWAIVRAHLNVHGRVLVYESTQREEVDEAHEPLLSADGDVGGLLKDKILTQEKNTDDVQISRHYMDIPGLKRRHSIVCMQQPIQPGSQA